MFRYGGPIKEGVMNGIREPKRNGGSMANNEGPRRAALVGNPIYPEVDGRTNHLAPIPIGMGIAAGARAILPAVVRYGKPLLQGAKRIFGKTTPASVTKGTKFNRAQSVKEFGPGSGRATGVTMNPSKFDPNYLGRDPIVRSVGAIGKGIFSPTSKGVVAKAARFATAPSSIVAGVAYYMWPDGEERTNPPPKKTDGVNTPSGNNPFGYKDDVKTTTFTGGDNDGPLPNITPVVPKLIAEEVIVEEPETSLFSMSNLKRIRDRQNRRKSFFANRGGLAGLFRVKNQ